MAITKLRISGRDFALMPWREYERVTARLAEDARDVRRAKKALAHYRRTGLGVSLETLQRELGN